MKRIGLIIIVYMLLISIIGCDNNSSAEQVYIDMAQEYIDGSDYDSAVDILQKGIDSTGSSKLSDMLKNILEIQMGESTDGGSINTDGKIDIANYIGIWATEDIGRDKGGSVLNIYRMEGGLFFDFEIRNSAPGMESVYFSYILEDDLWENSLDEPLYIELDKGKASSVTLDLKSDKLWSMDGEWTEYGTITFTFNSDSIDYRMDGCSFYNVDNDRCSGTLTLNNDAYDSFSYEWEENQSALDGTGIIDDSENNYFISLSNDYYETDEVLIKPYYVYWDNGDLIANCYISNGYSESVTNIDVQSFSLYNEQGLIAEGSFGMLTGLVIEPLSVVDYTLRFTSDSISLYGADLMNSFSWGSRVAYHFVKETVDTSKASGILASLDMTEDEFRNSCQPLKRDIASSSTIIVSDLRDYPSKYIGQHFTFTSTTGKNFSIEITSKSISNDGYTTYYSYPNEDWQGYLLFFDMRDDIYYPTVSKGDRIHVYVIFNGVQTINGIDYITFKLISLDKE